MIREVFTLFDNDDMKTSFFLSLTFVLKCVSKSILIRFKRDRDNLIQIVNLRKTNFW